MSATSKRCRARTRKGERCRNPAGPDGLCAVHRHQAADAPGSARRGTARRGTARRGTARQGRPEPHPPDSGAPAREGNPAGDDAAAAVHSPHPHPHPAPEPALAPEPHSEPAAAPEPEPALAPEPAPEPFASFLDWAEEAIEFLGRRVLGEYEVDEFGHDPDLVEHVLAPLLRPLYRHWWRVETRGLEHVPDSGPALVVGNHAGTLPFDALMVALALLDEHPAHRSLRMLAADLAFDLPVVAPLARKSGNTLACAEDATRLLEAGELVGVWPEGYKGLGKPYRERYQLQRFGRGGFVEVALRTGAPIVPVAVVGSEEIYPMLANLRRLARLLGLPYFPVTPTFPALGPLGAIPLPSKWLIEFCPPIETAGLGPDAVLDPMVLFDLTDQVRDTIQQTIHRNLLERGGTFG
jgi:1-acyl-sn-glycerol-3-phosphate acyltransferase